MIPRVIAEEFHRFMRVGRTTPALLGASNEGVSHLYVVKLSGSPELGARGSAFELLSLELASYFEIAHPPAAIISLGAELANIIAEEEPSKADMVLASVGVNFGTEYIINFTTWPVDRMLPNSMIDRAAAIFAFDALIQNPDRRFDNPNLAVQDGTLLIYDHDLAFSFLRAILPSQEPWNIDKEPYLANHVFYNGLRKEKPEFGGFIERLKSLPMQFIDHMEASLPVEWRLDDFQVIKAHLIAVQQSAPEFEAALHRRLA